MTAPDRAAATDRPIGWQLENDPLATVRMYAHETCQMMTALYLVAPESSRLLIMPGLALKERMVGLNRALNNGLIANQEFEDGVVESCIEARFDFLSIFRTLGLDKDRICQPVLAHWEEEIQAAGKLLGSRWAGQLVGQDLTFNRIMDIDPETRARLARYGSIVSELTDLIRGILNGSIAEDDKRIKGIEAFLHH